MDIVCVCGVDMLAGSCPTLADGRLERVQGGKGGSVCLCVCVCVSGLLHQQMPVQQGEEKGTGVWMDL